MEGSRVKKVWYTHDNGLLLLTVHIYFNASIGSLLCKLTIPKSSCIKYPKRNIGK